MPLGMSWGLRWTDRAAGIHHSLPSRKMRLKHEGEPGRLHVGNPKLESH